MAAITHGPPVAGAVHPRARRLRPAGGRGLVRQAVRQAAGPHARVHRDHPPDPRPRGPGDLRGRAVPAAARGRHRAGQAAEVRRSGRSARTCRSSWPPRAPRTSRWPPRSATAGWRSSTRPSTTASTATRSTRASPARARGARATTSRSSPPCRSSSPTTSTRRSTPCARCTPCTSAAWARATATSTPTSRGAWATRPRSTRSRTSTSAGKKDEAAAAIPRALIEQLTLIGPREKILHDLEPWKASQVTTLLVQGAHPGMLEDLASLVA